LILGDTLKGKKESDELKEGMMDRELIGSVFSGHGRYVFNIRRKQS